jgi:SAM-dependent methyltransferase
MAVRFDTVDTNDPAACIAFLDLAWSLEDVQRAKALSHEMLLIRAGDHVLDIGCGTGADAVALARSVGAAGHVIGVDLSQAMVDVAAARAAPFGLPISFRQADIHVLPFADASFDAVRIDRVLHFLPNPRNALEEVVRVTAYGGRVVLTEPDWSTLDIFGGDDTLNTLVLGCGGSAAPAARIGARLDSLLEECGLQFIEQRDSRLVLRDYRTAKVLFSLESIAQRAVTSGVVTLGDARNWLRSLQQAAARCELRIALAGTIASGVRPT